MSAVLLFNHQGATEIFVLVVSMHKESHGQKNTQLRVFTSDLPP